MTSPNAEATTAETFDHALPTDSDSAATGQAVVTAGIHEIEASYRASGVVELQPRLDYPPYRSSLLRHPTKDLRHADPEFVELWAPCFGQRDVGALESDLTIQHTGEPIGERMVVTGRVVNGDGRPVRHQLVEIWQANAAGRYIHQRDQHPAPVDPHFTGVGRCLTDDDGSYRFTTAHLAEIVRRYEVRPTEQTGPADPPQRPATRTTTSTHDAHSPVVLRARPPRRARKTGTPESSAA